MPQPTGNLAEMLDTRKPPIAFPGDRLSNWDTFRSSPDRVLVVAADQVEDGRIRTGLANDGVSVFTLHCGRCPTEREFLTQIGAAFAFPDYYGHNLDALDECLFSPDYLGNVHAVFVFSQAQLLLAEESKHIGVIADIIATAGCAWNQIAAKYGQQFYAVVLVDDINCTVAQAILAAKERVDLSADYVGDGPWEPWQL